MNRSWSQVTVPLLVAALIMAIGAVGYCETPTAEWNRLHSLGERQYIDGEFREMETTARRMVVIAKSHFRGEKDALALATDYLGHSLRGQGRYKDALSCYERSAELWEKFEGKNGRNVAGANHYLGTVYSHVGRTAESEAALQKALRIFRERKDKDADCAAMAIGTLSFLSGVYRDMNRLADSEQAARQAVKEAEKNGHERILATSLANLQEILLYLGKYDEAESIGLRAMEVYEKAYGPDHNFVACAIDVLVRTLTTQQRFAEAEPLAQRSLRILEKAVRPGHPDIATSLRNLADIYVTQGKYDAAEQALRRALEIRTEEFGRSSLAVGDILNRLGVAYAREGRSREAEPLYREALQIRTDLLPEDAKAIAVSLNNLGRAYVDLDRLDEALPLLERALEISRANSGPRHAETALALRNLALLKQAQGNLGEAQELLEQTVEIYGEALGSEHSRTAEARYRLALTCFHAGDYPRAERLTDESLEVQERLRLAPAERYESYLLRAQIAWQTDRQSEALGDLREAIRLAELQRTHFTGAELERARSYARFRKAFELMLKWQTQIGDTAEALNAFERSRARSLLDEIALIDTDLNLGRTSAESRYLLEQEGRLRQEIASIERRIELLAQHETNSDPAKLQGYVEKLASAKEQLYEHLREERSSSPIYRNLLSTGAAPPRLSQLRRQIDDDGTILLLYFLGDEGSYVICVGAAESTVVPLAVTEQQAKSLGINSGPLNALRCEQLMTNTKETGVLQQLRNPEIAEDPDAFYGRMNALWNVLVPPLQQDQILEEDCQRLLIVPDGILGQLPFETLVVDTVGDPQYLLDVGPPIHYVPSASMLLNLRRRRAQSEEDSTIPVLAVGNPAYGSGSMTAEHATSTAQPPQAAAARYASLTGPLSELRYSSRELAWVDEVMSQEGVTVETIAGRDATEANVRTKVARRAMLLFSCHGLVDQAHRNLFGALALTPGPERARPDDDGFLTLAEIYNLDLDGNELAILSACETNLGPQQRGEGIWALSRGFLVAGSKRVVASNWLVDDEAAASFVSFFCGGIALGQGKWDSVDYARALRDAKRWIRNNPQHPEWKSPYFWAPFVLVGPN